MTEGAGGGERTEGPIFRDIRRYYCEYCGICRSKKSLIASHVLSQHKDEIEVSKAEDDMEAKGPVEYKCEQCGVSFRKPAYLKQHMQGHSLERPFACPVNDCRHSYRRKDHLTRHLLQHQGKLFTCSIENCNHQFAYRGNMQRHVNELHDEESPCDIRGQKQYICSEIGCGKVFKYPSKLRRHEDSHVKLDCVEFICCEPGCMKHFSNGECLKAHVQSCHRYVQCPTCGTKQLKKNLKRHQCIHEGGGLTERIKCTYPRCLHTYTKRSNLNKHVKAIHLEFRPFTCSISGCGQKFSFRHVRDNHEKCSAHVFVPGDFIESDEQFLSRPRGGRKRKCVLVESLLRKRIAAEPDQTSVLDNVMQYMS